MAKDLKSFIKSGKAPSGEKQPSMNDLPPDLRKKTEELEGKSESELLSELQKSVAAGKADGSFNQKTVDQFKKNVAPMLNKEQKTKLEALLRQFGE